MPMLQFTDAAVRRLKAKKGTRVEYFDRKLRGFGLRVSGPSDRDPTGNKTWVCFYRVGRQLRRYTLGKVSNHSLKDARRLAREALALADQGKDLVELKRQRREREIDTIEEVAVKFAAHLERQGRSPGYVDETRSALENHVIPRWRGRDVLSIKRRDVIAVLDAVASGETVGAGKSKRGYNLKGGRHTANAVRSALAGLFKWCIRSGIRDDTPVALTERQDVKSRQRTLSVEEVRELWPRFRAINFPYSHFYELALVTAQRRGEVATMRWADVDEAEKLWTIPAEMTKARRIQLVPLSPLAMRILEDCKRRTLELRDGRGFGEFVFTVDGRGPIKGFGHAKERLDAAAQIDRWRNHDLRRTGATLMAKIGVSQFVIARVLNHTDSSVTSVYNRYEYLAEKRHALEAWGSYLENRIAPPGANVITMRG
jgi:integrase